MNRYSPSGPMIRDASATTGPSARRGIESSPGGYAVLVAFFAAILVWSPSAGELGLTVFTAGLSSTALAIIEGARASRRVKPSARTRGWRLALLAIIALIVVAAAVASAWVPAYGVALASVTGAAVLLGTWILERPNHGETA